MNHIVVVGAGLGGLSAAIRLAHSGYRVTVVEKNERVGGKMNQWQEGGYTFDTGPSLLTMPFVLHDLFSLLGKHTEDYLELMPVEPICRYFFSDGTTLDACSDETRMASEISRLSPGDVGGFQKFLRHGQRIYDASAGPFLLSGFGSWNFSTISRSLKYVPSVFKLDAFRTLNDAVSSHVNDARLRQLLNRFATYNGSSPYIAPATLSIIPYVEFRMGAWYIRGGMYRLACVLAQLAQELGVTLRTSTEVKQFVVDGDSVTGILTADGETIDADAAVCNADALYAYGHLLPAEAIRRPRFRNVQPSLSGFVMLLGVKRLFPQLLQHNIFFSSEYEAEFDALISEQVPAADPTIYLNLTCKIDETHAPKGRSNAFILVNAPPLPGRYDWGRHAADYRDLVLKKLSACGLDSLVRDIEVERVFTPEDFESCYNAFRGSIYGASSNSRMSAFLRPPNRSKDFQRLYFVGGSSHPGGGIPLVLLSGKIVADLVEGDWRRQ